MPGRPGRDGFRFVLGTCAVTCLLLVFNGVLVASIYFHNVGSDGVLDRYPKLTQAAVFMAPIVLVIIQWWIIDVVSRTLARRRENRTGS
ncbi:MAG: hypothetical protein QGH11_12030 [Pirellulaceae bacterium]|nr:hypothetical protein [Pirellulaceae bacterium]